MFMYIGQENTTEKVVTKSTDTETTDQLDTISEKSSIKDIKDDNTELEDEFKDPLDETIDLKTMDESSI